MGVVSLRPSGVQVTLDAPHDDAGLSEIVTGPLPEGRTSIQYSSNPVLSTRRLPIAVPPVMASALRTALFLSNGSAPSKISSLNTSRNRNLLAPSCSAGTAAIAGREPGPALCFATAGFVAGSGGSVDTAAGAPACAGFGPSWM